MKRSLIALALALILAGGAFAEPSSGAAFFGNSGGIRLDPFVDGGLCLAGAAGFIGAKVYVRSVDLTAAALPGYSTVNAFDRSLARPYSAGIDRASDILEALVLAAPYATALVLDGEPAGGRLRTWKAMALVAETQLLALGAKDTLKVLIQRPRPYNYQAGTPAEMLADEDSRLSCPSGHTTMAFASSAAASVLALRFIESPALKWTVVGLSNGLAAAVGASRIAAGMHYATDVAAGAGLGLLVGGLNAYLHLAESDDQAISFSLAPSGFSAKIRL